MPFFATAWIGERVFRTEITEDQFRCLTKVRNDVLFAVGLEEKLSLLLANFAEFERELLTIAHEVLVWPKFDRQRSMTHRLLLDRRLVNLLTAARLYLDQTEHGVSGLFGNPSRELETIKSFRNSLWDNYWGYRLLEAVRNHVQHVGLPIHKISYPHCAVNAPACRDVEVSVIPSSLTRSFAQDPKFKPKVLAEMREWGDELDLRRPIREYVTCCIKLHDELRRVTNDRLTESRTAYSAAIAEYGTVNGTAATWIEVESAREDTGVVSERVYLGADMLELLDSLVERNRVTPDLCRLSVTSRGKT